MNHELYLQYYKARRKKHRLRQPEKDRMERLKLIIKTAKQC